MEGVSEKEFLERRDFEQCKVAEITISKGRSLLDSSGRNITFLNLYLTNPQSECFQKIVRDLTSKKWSVEVPQRGPIGQVHTVGSTKTVSFRPPMIW